MNEMAPPAAVPHSTARRSVSQRLWRSTVSTFAVIGLVSVLRPFTFDISRLASGSMSPTLKGDASGGDWVLAEKISYYFRQPRRWEIVEFNDKEGLQIMKRVAALPSETIAIQQNRLQINGQNIDLPEKVPPVKYFPYGNLASGKSSSAGSGFYVLGDDSIDSEDSRYEGPLTPDRIRARAWIILWPPSRIGWVR